jgi:hypothetical protein
MKTLFLLLATGCSLIALYPSELPAPSQLPALMEEGLTAMLHAMVLVPEPNEEDPIPIQGRGTQGLVRHKWQDTSARKSLDGMACIADSWLHKVERTALEIILRIRVLLQKHLYSLVAFRLIGVNKIGIPTGLTSLPPSNRTAYPIM